MSRGEGRAWASRTAGRVARTPASRWLIPWFARHYRIAVGEALEPEGGFRNLQQFFCRPLRAGLRPIAGEVGVVVSPVDGAVGACGRVERGQLLQAKGRSYSLGALLGDDAAAGRFQEGLYCTLYLAPSDYHRVHAPEAGSIGEARYIPGTFWPVNPRAVASVPGLFAANERLVSYLDTARGRLAVVMVGACLVGAIRVNYDPGWNAGPGLHGAAPRRYDPPHAFARGQELGRFEFGSTVILLAEPAAAAVLLVASGARIRYGEPLMAAAGAAGTPPPAAY